MADWMRGGCDQCRRGILAGRGDMPVPMAVSRLAHASLRHREARVIPEAEARRTFAAHFGDQAAEGGA